MRHKSLLLVQAIRSNHANREGRPTAIFQRLECDRRTDFLREIRSFTLNYYNAVREMLNPIPWLANFNKKKLHGYLEQDFDAAERSVKEVGQASDITECNQIYVAYIQQCVELFAAQILQKHTLKCQVTLKHILSSYSM